MVFKSTAVAYASAQDTFRFWGFTNQSSVQGSGPVSPLTDDSVTVSIIETPSGLGNWLLSTSIGGVAYVVDSGVPVVSGQRYTTGFKVTGGVATLYIDGTPVATNSNIPTANALFMFICQQRISGLVSVVTDIEYLYGENAAV
jgi:hypothetical protein